ncbi:hypothetical protein NDR87_15330 [Nocardia sp. CDC159]|uniref:Uncharacterized protein n=1 Tax=Nocardia pulmonis TaxID=2951408 RepID=A0A9X2E8F2_9NOCA|nr:MULTISPECIES: hypothetical protein [Nocardia]MCM6775536.1 hypothetical protein [Nocardia pulmonis]MCM6787730.1 hypothetical protein [Nocardia sp. CDC159]
MRGSPSSSRTTRPGWGGPRRLVALAARNDVGSLVAYLGALNAGCVVLLTEATDETRLGTYDPDVVIEATAGGGVPTPLDPARPVGALPASGPGAAAEHVGLDGPGARPRAIRPRGRRVTWNRLADRAFE